MKKSELVYLLLAEGAARTQLEASAKLGISLSTVSNAVEPLRRMGAVEVNRNGMKVLDKRKLLLHWASVHVQRQIYSTCVEGAGRAEREVPGGVLFTSFTAFKRIYGNPPADYGELYLYAGEDALAELKKRFPPSKRKANFFVLEAPEQLFRFGKAGCVPPSLVFVDLWNCREWYASEFVKVLEEKLYGSRG